MSGTCKAQSSKAFQFLQTKSCPLLSCWIRYPLLILGLGVLWTVLFNDWQPSLYKCAFLKFQSLIIRAYYKYVLKGICIRQLWGPLLVMLALMITFTKRIAPLYSTEIMFDEGVNCRDRRILHQEQSCVLLPTLLLILQMHWQNL